MESAVSFGKISDIGSNTSLEKTTENICVAANILYNVDDEGNVTLIDNIRVKDIEN